MHIRPACDADAVAAADVLRRSIRELCVQDHQNEPEILDAWLSNKTADTFREWLAVEHQPLLVVERDRQILAVGGVRQPDEILLNYVAPEARFQGVSKLLLASMEGLLMGFGSKRSHLTSTRTAYAFYYAAGYRDAGRSGKFGMSTLDMAKDLIS
jgi:GNAT superfamily N-acetyltransferase